MRFEIVKLHWHLPANSFRAYAFAALCVIAAVTLRVALDAWLAQAAPLVFITLFPAVLIAAVVGGLGPGLFALGIGFVYGLHYFAAPPLGLPTTAGWVALALYGIGSLVMVAAAGALRQALDRLNERERHLSILVQHVPAGIFQTDRDGHYVFVNERFADLVGRPRQELKGLRYLDVTHPDDRAENERLRLKALRTRSGYALRKRYLRPDGAPVWAEMNVTALAGGRGEGTIGVAVDLTERMRGEAQQNLLINELNHRVKNTLASVQSLALMTLRSDASPEAFVRTFFDRIRALSVTHDLLTEGHWESARLRDVVSVEVAPYAGPAGDRLAVEGDPVALRPRQALALGMLFHELATNAAKYGAWSRPRGRVLVSWKRLRDGPVRLRIDWCERDGPVVAAPQRRGFGTRLIERSVAEDLGGTVAFDFAPAGLCCAIEIPLE